MQHRCYNSILSNALLPPLLACMHASGHAPTRQGSWCAQERQDAWRQAFRSLLMQQRAGICDAFYVLSPEVRGRGGLRVHVTAGSDVSACLHCHAHKCCALWQCHATYASAGNVKS